MSDVLVLCYHAVSERWPAALAVSPSQLDRQLRFLLARGYRGATFTEAVTGSASGRCLAVTFDDGYRSVLEDGAPVLARLGLPATIFVPTDFVGSGEPMAWPGIDHWLGGPHERELLPLTWGELDGLARSGWEVGSHSRSHTCLTRLDDAGLAAELHGSRIACEERLGRPCESLAYPYGEVDARVVSAAREAGYVAGADLPPRIGDGSALRSPRVGVYRPDGDARFRLKVWRPGRKLRRLPPWQAIDLARRRVARARETT